MKNNFRFIFNFTIKKSGIIFRDVEVKKSEIRLKSENLHPCMSATVSAFVSVGV